MLTFNTVFISIMVVFQLILAFTNKDKEQERHDATDYALRINADIRYIQLIT